MDGNLHADPLPPLMSLIAAAHPEYHLPQCLTGRYADDVFFGPIVQQPGRYAQFDRRDGLFFLGDSNHQILCIPDITIGSRKLREIIISQAHSILAHLGSQKTIHYLKDNVWWPGLTSDIKAFCDSCHVCATMKSTTTQPYGLLHPLPVPDNPWDVVGIDFVGLLPELHTHTGLYDMICVIIDHFTHMVHLVPTVQMYCARDIAEVMFKHVCKYHGLPHHIISDRDSLFTGQFWDQLHKLVSIDLHKSSAFHPQTDGLTERTNCTLSQML